MHLTTAEASLASASIGGVIGLAGSLINNRHNRKLARQRDAHDAQMAVDKSDHDERMADIARLQHREALTAQIAYELEHRD